MLKFRSAMVKKLNIKPEEVSDSDTVENIVISDTEEDDEICEVEHFRKLFIGGLAGQTNEGRLRQFYSKWGTVVDAVVVRDSNTKRSRGFGFVTYSKVAMLDKAQANRPHIIDGKTVESKRALPRPEKQPTEAKKSASVKKLFIGGIKDVHDEQSLNTYFSEFGNVVSIQILKDNVTGKRRGFAMVAYDDYDAVDKAILQKTHLVNNALLDVRKSIYVTDDNKKSFEVRKAKIDIAKKNIPFTNSKSAAPMASHMANHNNRPEGRSAMQTQQFPYHGPPQHGQQPYNPMGSYQQGPPPNNNHWGPQSGPRFTQPSNANSQQPPPVMPQQQPPNMPPPMYSGYTPGPMQPPQPQVPPSGTWNNYQPTSNGNVWNGAPPPPQPPPQPPVCPQLPAPNWQNSQWSQQFPSAMPSRPMHAANPPPPINWQQPPTSQVAGGPPPGIYQQPQNQQNVPPPPPPVNNFGHGYQQDYAGGPTKHLNAHTNRMNPYNAPTHHYNNNSTAQGYGSGITSGNRHRR